MRQNERAIVVYSDGSQVDIITKIKEGKVITVHFGPGTRILENE